MCDFIHLNDRRKPNTENVYVLQLDLMFLNNHNMQQILYPDWLNWLFIYSANRNAQNSANYLPTKFYSVFGNGRLITHCRLQFGRLHIPTLENIVVNLQACRVSLSLKSDTSIPKTNIYNSETSEYLISHPLDDKSYHCYRPHYEDFSS